MTIAQRDFASLTDVGVTTRLGDIKRRLLTLGEELEGVAHQRVASFVGDRLKEVEQHSCRIAVIGQIKAGKSSLVNALTRRPDLLPTDVNPSTAVITKLYFGGPAERNNSALFHFFSDEEWDRIMSGGRVGAHSLQRSSAVDGPRLQDQLGELRNRAEKRLGPQLGKLLGKHHLFNSVTGSVLERYVSAGDSDSEVAEDDEDRHYSDITKTAEIYLEGQPLGYPAVLIDTPGVNDPFLVRDEITHANLGDADIYLVVLTAQQPLSKSDLALLRMLRGLQKDRIIAVVNRVDILSGASNDYQRLTSFVQDALRQEFPHATIPVILASARWGNAALNSDDDEMASLLGPAFTAFAEWSGSVPAKETSSWSPDRYWPTPLICQAFYKASGVPAIIAAIARLIGHSVAEERILPTASTLGAIAENTATSLRHNLKSMQAKLRDPARAPVALFRDQAGQTLGQLERLLSHIEQTLDRADREFSKSVMGDLQRLRSYMHFRCEQFAEHQTKRLAELGFSPALRNGFHEESFQLRGQLAEDFYKYLTDTAKDLVARQRDTEGELRKAAEQTLAELDNVLHFGFQPPNFSPPSLIALSKTTAFDLDDFWNPHNARGGDRAEEANAFQDLVKSEFGDMVDELLRLAESALQDHIATAQRRLRFLSYSAIYPIAQQLQHFATTLQEKEATSAGAMARAELFGDLFEAGDEELRRCQTLAAAMQTLRRQCIEMLDR
jgi:tRNA U34 5-carboxymethylaminomethyl modifying GTPase MnmE/TrmE